MRNRQCIKNDFQQLSLCVYLQVICYFRTTRKQNLKKTKIVRQLPSIFILTALSLKLQAQQQTDTLKNDRFSIHAQTTVINQFKPSFGVKYSGDNSLVPQQENRTSITSTLFMGVRLWKGASVFVNPEIAGGSGLSDALGIAAATNGETFRIGDPAPQLYLARLFYRQVFSLTTQTTYQTSDFVSAP